MTALTSLGKRLPANNANYRIHIKNLHNEMESTTIKNILYGVK